MKRQLIPLILITLLITSQAWGQIVSNGNGGGGSSSGGGVTSVSTTAGTGAFTCNFAAASTCVVTESDNTSPLVPTITNLPTNAFVNFVFFANGHSAIAVNWPSSSPNVQCPGATDSGASSADNWGSCGNVNWFTGNSTTTGYSATTFWSDGTNLSLATNAIRGQTVSAAHGNFNNAEVGYNGGATLKLTLQAGSMLASNNAGGTNVAPTVTGADGTHCGSGAAFVSSSFPTTTRFDITMGSTNPTTVCPVTYGTNANCSLGSTCVATDASTFQTLQCVGGTTGLTITAATDMHGDTVHVINICWQ